MNEQDWDARYSESDRLWSGNPNPALVSVADGLTPGTVLDAGCGEGADALWLAQHGWTVTGLEISGVALDRGRRAAEASGLDIEWVHAGLADAGPLGPFDLVATLYPAIPHTPDSAAEHALIAAVKPGGRLLYVHHTHLTDPEHDHGFDPSGYISDETVRAAASGWEVELDETRERHVAEGAGAHHKHDLVLLLRRPE